MSRLSSETLAQLPAYITVPNYNREVLKSGIVHLGVGAFHRAHQAWYTEQAINQYGGDWGIVGASLRSDTVYKQLADQDGLYSLLCKSSESSTLQVIGALKKVITAPRQSSELLHHLGDPGIQVVTLTITEKGYCYDFSTGELDYTNPVIEDDLRFFGEKSPQSAIAYLVAGLQLRQTKGAPVTIISCDNMPSNGKVLRQVVTDFAEKISSHLAQWIDDNVAFPCSMVDRIVPATTNKELAKVNLQLGLEDHGAVHTEPFCQWIIEKHFVTRVPDWDKVGAIFVDDVQPFEDMKLRLLNGSHSIIAYMGYLAGHDYVHEVVADPVLRELVRVYMDKVASPTLQVPSGFDLQAYKEQLMDRFTNRSLNHQTAQIAQDGSQKISQRWLSILEDIDANADISSTFTDGASCSSASHISTSYISTSLVSTSHISTSQGSALKETSKSLLSLVLAGWIRYLQGARDSGERYEVIDPLASTFSRISSKYSDSGDFTREIIGCTDALSSVLQSDTAMCDAIVKWHGMLVQRGALETVRLYLSQFSKDQNI